MTDKDGLAERGRAMEDDYFRKRDQELIEELRRAAGRRCGAGGDGAGR